MSGRTIRWVVAGLLAVGLAVSILPFSGTSYQVIEEMEQTINGRQVTVKGRIRWPQNVTIHVYIPSDPQGSGAEHEVQAACRAWEARLRSETNANLTFEYHVGQSAPPLGPDDPPPYVIEVNWTDEETSGEPGTATPVSDVTQSDDGTYQRGDTYRGIININRNQSPDQPYSGNAIYNIALHEFGHIFGLDHKTPEQDSVIMDDRGIDDPNKKHPIKDDDVRGLQDINGRNPSSTVPPKEGDGDEEDEESGEPSGTMCCAFECGGAFGCAMVNSEAECEGYNGVIQPGTCEATSQEDQDQGVSGRCNGGFDPIGSCCGSDLGSSQFIAASGTVAPGGQVSFILSIRNEGNAPTWFSVTMVPSPWLHAFTYELSTRFAPGSEPFDAPPAVTSCILPAPIGSSDAGGGVSITYSATLSEDAPVGESVTSTVLLEDMLRSELYVFTVECVPDVSGTGLECVEMIGRACDGADSDLCKEGTYACEGGVLVCTDTTGNTVEVCNGVDDDCDGQVDEDDPSLGNPCDGPDRDECEEGVIVCSGGVLVCTDTTGNTVEVCNGVDDDCDGQVDEDDPSLGNPCDGPDRDECEEGVIVCSGGVLVCTDTTGSNREVCNGVDDDCDGQIDEDDPSLGDPCDGSDSDECEEGVIICSGGVLMCSDTTDDSVEDCANGVDDDCDGAIDGDDPDCGG